MCDRTALRGVCVRVSFKVLYVTAAVSQLYSLPFLSHSSDGCPVTAEWKFPIASLSPRTDRPRYLFKLRSEWSNNACFFFSFFWCMRVCAPFRSVDRSWPISLSASCCCGVLRVWCGAAYWQIKQSPDGPCACLTCGSMTQSLNQGSEPNTTHDLELISKE